MRQSVTVPGMVSVSAAVGTGAAVVGRLSFRRVEFASSNHIFVPSNTIPSILAAPVTTVADGLDTGYIRMLVPPALACHTFVPSKARVGKPGEMVALLNKTVALPAAFVGLKTWRAPWSSAIHTKPANTPSFLGLPETRLHVSIRRRSAAFTLRILPSCRAWSKTRSKKVTTWLRGNKSFGLKVVGLVPCVTLSMNACRMKGQKTSFADTSTNGPQLPCAKSLLVWVGRNMRKAALSSHGINRRCNIHPSLVWFVASGAKVSGCTGRVQIGRAS